MPFYILHSHVIDIFEHLWYNTKIGVIFVDVRTGDTLRMKKQHPCGADTFLVLRTGMDFRVRCTGCGHELMAPRSKIEKSIKQIIRNDNKDC